VPRGLLVFDGSGLRARYDRPNRQAAGYIDRVLQGETLANLGAAADQVWTGNQPQDCQRAWAHHATLTACPRRRGDRI